MSDLAVANLGIENHGVESSSRAALAGLTAAAGMLRGRHIRQAHCTYRHRPTRLKV
jgi:hypothetical protein